MNDGGRASAAGWRFAVPARNDSEQPKINVEKGFLCKMFSA
jgi:hypothetical protein